MPLSMYEVSVGMFLTRLNALSHVLSKAAADATARGLDEGELLATRLAPDMLPLSAQVQIATDHAKGAAARLAGRDVPSFPDDEKNFAELQQRIGRIVDYLKTFSPADLEGSEERPIVLKLRTRELNFVGKQYLLGFALPNFYFHVTTAYDILRHKGAPLGKVDFIHQV